MESDGSALLRFCQLRWSAVKAIEPAWHEYAANFLLADDLLAPYFVADSRVKHGGVASF
jgi:hypothetical protein